MAPARLLDLTRLMSRLGKGPMTGVDRVEYAYLGQFLQMDTLCMGLARTALGFLLLDRAAMASLHAGSLDIGQNDLIGRLAWRRDPARGRAEAALRRLAIARCSKRGLTRMLRRHLPQGTSYFSTGHANLDSRSLSQIRAAGLRIAVLVHDTIPLDHPEFARPDTVEPFRRKMQAVANHADLVIHTTRSARTQTEAQLANLGRVPAGLTANLGVPVAQPIATSRPAKPYFVTLGTIEPRKNHALLLDLWAQMPNPPGLLIIGGRGWSNVEVFARLDALPPDSPIQHRAGLPDGEVAFLLQGAQALLFPSYAEGFGIPAVEAAALGTPVICSDLAVFQELLGEFAVYLDVTDSYSWMETIARLTKAEVTNRKVQQPPSWAEHFKLVLSQM
ncbi:glycosyl transferase [Cypionkella aquatica]|uniref:Glycosyl transferase n=1 Tax=Cypionkella aquatica TaxID=1756042 RepID=A0AA37TR33_9RHOB|nr:glycosyltransferase family 1 protein [Cypionkella aquatica]GLS86174.1 glycosyl transferase [Cypionkella aquatica]